MILRMRNRLISLLISKLYVFSFQSYLCNYMRLVHWIALLSSQNSVPLEFRTKMDFANGNWVFLPFLFPGAYVTHCSKRLWAHTVFLTVRSLETKQHDTIKLQIQSFWHSRNTQNYKQKRNPILEESTSQSYSRGL